MNVPTSLAESSVVRANTGRSTPGPGGPWDPPALSIPSVPGVRRSLPAPGAGRPRRARLQPTRPRAHSAKFQRLLMKGQGALAPPPSVTACPPDRSVGHKRVVAIDGAWRTCPPLTTTDGPSNPVRRVRWTFLASGRQSPLAANDLEASSLVPQCRDATTDRTVQWRR